MNDKTELASHMSLCLVSRNQTVLCRASMGRESEERRIAEVTVTRVCGMIFQVMLEDYLEDSHQIGLIFKQLYASDETGSMWSRFLHRLSLLLEVKIPGMKFWINI